MAWLNIKNPEPEDSSQKVSYDEIPLFDFLVTRVRLLVIENRDVISVSLILIMGFAVFWTVKVSSQPTTVGTQAADETNKTNRINNNSGITPTPMVTILVITATPPTTVSPTIIPTLPLQELPTFTSTPTPLISPRPTNPFWEYLK